MRKFKKGLITILCMGTLLGLSGCGSSNFSSDTYNKGYATNDVAMESSSDDSYYTGGDYSNTYISGDQADYSYNFSAGGKTKKTKDEMLKDYESIQDFVNEKDGYIENVYNSYNYYDEENYYNKENKASGCLNFTIQIENEYSEDVIAKLEEICKENKFTVTNYTQIIHNYKNWTIVDNDEDAEYWNQTITQEELEKRLKYCDISVQINYNIPRSGFSKFMMSTKEVFSNFWESVGEVIQAFLAIAIGLIILFIQSIFFYKIYRRMIYKHKLKKPEYYSPKEVVIVKDDNEHIE